MTSKTFFSHLNVQRFTLFVSVPVMVCVLNVHYGTRRAQPLTNAGVITFFLFAKAANASMNTEEFINDPRNPRFKAGGVKEEH